jgi:hypothetical protein
MGHNAEPRLSGDLQSENSATNTFTSSELRHSACKSQSTQVNIAVPVLDIQKYLQPSLQTLYDSSS